ncbi:hypothetical protein [Puniceicoccus vermicola]|uniref:Uncharacterized protein n=1 Tax=Puniceicoccus vermicola TaxID=388746 RepID=A0A7X1AZE3_9BACT|nr:hypothetical protein [Puniceicoccus vermicola]MBC2602785.1 hypothetical protein [Puniceicoccus vermicola]
MSAPEGAVQVLASSNLGVDEWTDPSHLYFELESAHQLSADFEERCYRADGLAGSVPQDFLRVHVQ